MDESRVILECKQCAWRGLFSKLLSRTKAVDFRKGTYAVETRHCPDCDEGLWMTSACFLAERKD
jgi:hypothetical protein